MASSAGGLADGSAERHYPEQAYLSPTRYTNEFFGFSFDLPAEAHLGPIPQPVATDGRVQLLQLGGPAPTDAAVSIVAFPPQGKVTLDAKTVLRKALDQELSRGVEELHGLSKTSISSRQFYFYETRRGIDQHMVAAASLNGYVVVVQLGARNEKMVKDLESSFQQLVLFPPAQIRQYVAADAQPYEGPAISSHRLAQLEADPPKTHIDPGKIEGGVYRNPALGFSYQIPSGWILESQGALLPAIEQARAADVLAGLLGDGTPDAGVAERRLMNACSRTLFSVWAKRPGPDGGIPYDDFGEVTLSAISAECFPGARFPARSTDTQAVRDFMLLVGLTQPILRDMRDAKTFTAQGMVFVLLHGTIGFKVPNDELSRRLSIAMAITQRHGYLLTWFFAAPHDSELQQLMEERVKFDPAPTTEAAGSTKKGNGEAPDNASQGRASDTNSEAGSTSQTADGSRSGTSSGLPGGGSTMDTNAASTSAGGQNGASNLSGITGANSSSEQQNNPSSTPQPTRPSLLRPGETIESQQGSGAPVRKP